MEDSRLSYVSTLLIFEEPIPTQVGVGLTRLLGKYGYERSLLRQKVKTRQFGKRGGGLVTSVQNHDERFVLGACRSVKEIITFAFEAGVRATLERGQRFGGIGFVERGIRALVWWGDLG